MEGSTHILDFRTSKSSECIGAIRSSHESGLAEVILGLQVSHLGFVWTVDDADGDGEDSVSLEHISKYTPVMNCFLNSPPPAP